MITELNEKSEKKELFLLSNKKYAVVQCARFRCLAYRMPDGRWKMANSNEELADVVQLSEFF
jgi:hypothetical protein